MGAEPEIRKRIRERGKITFAEFMDLALFWPRGGYYTQLDNIGPKGDFYTAPGAHPAFGALLCTQAFQMWRLMDQPDTFWLVEMGAGSGLLCHDLMGYSTHLPPEFRESLRYMCLDRVPSNGVENQLPTETGTKVNRLAAQGIPLRGIKGCVLSNELVDSFPVHRVTVQGGELKEIYLTVKEGNLVEVLDSPSSYALEERLDSLGLSLPEGFSTEINLAMKPWMEEVSSALEQGFLLTIDYGGQAQELYSNSRSRGSLTSYYRHAQTGNPYLRVGEQDISAQVDFTSLTEIGTSCGLEPLGFNTQRDFLRNLGLTQFMGSLPATGLKQREIDANRMSMLDIVKPGGMGEFKVLAQGKGVGVPALWGFGHSPELETVLNGLPVPLLTSLHMPLMAGRYPHLAFEWEELLP